jgi:hypothetical protein
MAVLDLLPIPKKKKAPKGWAAPPIKVKRYTPPVLPSETPVPPRLLKKLRGISRKHRVVKTIERLAQMLTVAVMLLTIQMFVDWLSNLTVFTRFLLLVADFGLLAWFFWVKLGPAIKPLSLEACALKVEKHWKSFRGRMIATVQFAQSRTSADSPELIRAVQAETDGRTATMNFGQIVPAKMMVRRLLGAMVVSAIFASMMYFFQPASIALIERVFLMPAKVPRKTDITMLSGNMIIPAGANIRIEAVASGIVPSHGRVTLKDSNGKIREITVDADEDSRDHFVLNVDKVEDSLNYTVWLGDAESDTYSVKTIPRPNVTTIDCEQIYPPYTGLPNVKRTVGNLALLAGSKLKLHADTNSKVVKAWIKLIGLGKTLPLTISDDEPSQVSGQIDIPASNLTGFSIEITNQAGITSGDDTQYRIDLIPDHPPTVDLTYPERLQELFTLKAKPNIGFVAGDDYGLVKVTLCYRLVPDSGDSTTVTDKDTAPADNTPAPTTTNVNTPITRVEMNLNGTHPQNMKNRYPWDLAAIKPPLVEGNTIEYWMEAEDGNNVTGPGITDSEHHTIKIVSEAEKKADVMNRLVDSLSTITDITQNQQKINQDLGEVIEGKTAQPANTPAPQK